MKTTLIHALRMTAAAQLDQPALQGSRTYTYRELRDEMDCVARLVRGIIGAEPRQPVLVLGPTDASTAVLILGVMAAGCTAGVLDVRSSDARLREQIAAVGARVVCVIAALRPRVVGLGIAGLRIVTAEQAHSHVDAGPEAQDADVILFTSGFTGAAKAVQMSSERFPRIAAWSDCEVGPAIRRVGLILPISFEHGLNRTLYALLTGRTGVFYDLSNRGIVDLSTWIRAEQIDEISMPIDVMRSWMHELQATVDAAPLPLKRIVLTGAVYGRDLDLLWSRLEPEAVIGTVYASTETARIATHVVCRSDAYTAEDLLPVGKLYAGVAVRIVNDDGTATAPGEQGELFVRSPNLARGYFGDTQATDARFLRRVDGTVEYRTGDLAAFDADGLLRIYGRRDGVVKVRMQRIDLAEVEAALLALPEVRSAVSYVYAQGSENECIAALIVLHDGARMTMQSMRRSLAEHLPPYAIPSDVRVTNALPMTRFFKPDRGTLNEIAAGLPALPDYFEAANGFRDEFERQLAAVVGELLDAPIHDRYTEIHAAPEVMAEIAAGVRRRMHIDLTAAELTMYSTILELAALVRERRNAGCAPPLTQCITPLYGGRGSAEIFVVPAAGASVMRHRALARALQPAITCYGIEPLGFNDGASPQHSIDEMAELYGREVLQTAQTERVVLLGECFGSYVVLETARRLESAGRRPELVVLLDPPMRMMRRKSRSDADLIDLWHELSDLAWHGQWSSLWAVVRMHLVRSTLGQISRSRRRFDQVFIAHSAALWRHAPKPYSGPVLHLASAETNRNPAVRAFWRMLSSGVHEYVTLSGSDHRSITNGSDAAGVARLIEAALSARTQHNHTADTTIRTKSEHTQ